MKKIISDNVIKFPFDNAIKVDVRGKPLTFDEHVKQEELMSNLKEAMFLYMELNESFSDVNGEYYTVESFFKKQCEKEKGSDPTFDEEVFADCEKKRIERIIEQVKQLSDEPYYREHPVYTQAKKYIKHLDKVIKGQIKEVESDKIHKLLIYSKNDVNMKTLDNVLIKCIDNLHGINFDKSSYAALYYIIFDKYKNFFKPGIKFTKVQKCFDEYFNQDTRTSKQGKAKNKAEMLKSKNPWINRL